MSIRIRLTLWYGVLLAASLVLFDLLIYGLMSDHLYSMVDADLRQQARQAALLLGRGTVHAQPLPGPTDAQALGALLEFFRAPGSRVAILRGDGQLLAHSPVGSTIPAAIREHALRLTRADFQGLASHREGGASWRLYAQRLDALGARWGLPDPPVLLMDARAEAVGFTLSRLLLYLGTGTVLILGLGTWVGWRLASAPLRPIAEATGAARAIALSRSFTRRLAAPAVRSDEVGELIATLNEMLESLQQSYESQKQFVANASHELRAPLTTLKGNLALLDQWDRLEPGERSAVLADLRSETERMIRLVSGMLALARADAGQVARLRPVDVDQVVLEVARSFRLRAEGHRFRLGPFEPVHLEADPDLIKQLLVILLDNAFCYTPAGGRVELGVTRDGDEAVLEVADTGIGIAPGDLPHIFDRFYRADRARTRSSESAGLGLAIARWIVESHGGRIEVDSRAGAGSRFTVRLPLRRGEAGAGSPAGPGRQVATMAVPDAEGGQDRSSRPASPSRPG
ncbi:sensor histidine kinase [Limnochorda pilosa]|uniref:histidine kinase n=1 Tax=Limnochorda pilosa TaxID=1555112 RepID=A0A0K2SQ21_LIMPI|nr:HAMP domain-containing sensor histidine kinase [Limnochorda pilosa]BAS29218.1 histidine kinase [Limnochorda pilosa]